jgi:hypothetical protein
MNKELKTKYQSQNKEIQKKVSSLMKKLETHNKDFNDNLVNWGYLGDLCYVNEKLDEVLSFIR